MFSCVDTTFCIDSSGVIQGPPARAKPSLTCIPSLRSKRLASSIANFTIAHHCGLSCSAAGVNMGGLTAPLMGIRYAPPIPAVFMASRSAVIPDFETAAFIQYQNTQGFVVSFCWAETGIPAVVHQIKKTNKIPFLLKLIAQLFFYLWAIL
ncbi:hypothetical protein D3C87_1319090 [compost metagenome]